MNRNGIGGLPDVLFPTEGEKSAGNETRYYIRTLSGIPCNVTKYDSTALITAALAPSVLYNGK